MERAYFSLLSTLAQIRYSPGAVLLLYLRVRQYGLRLPGTEERGNLLVGHVLQHNADRERRLQKVSRKCEKYGSKHVETYGLLKKLDNYANGTRMSESVRGCSFHKSQRRKKS